jgi:hypothetical protein
MNVRADEWHSIEAWQGLAEIIGEYVAKGSKLYVEGKMSRGGASINILKTYIEQPKTPL